MKIHIEIDEKELARLVANRIYELMPDAGIKEVDIKIQVKSKQNYKAEWESASFRAMVDV